VETVRQGHTRARSAHPQMSTVQLVNQVAVLGRARLYSEQFRLGATLPDQVCVRLAFLQHQTSLRTSEHVALNTVTVENRLNITGQGRRLLFARADFNSPQD